MGKTFSGSADFVYACAASLDGTIVVSGGQDGVLRVWDVAKGTELKNFAPPADPTNQQAQK
jgi:WD40 repeat protein